VEDGGRVEVEPTEVEDDGVEDAVEVAFDHAGDA